MKIDINVPEDSNWEIPSTEPFDELDAKILAALEKRGDVIPVTVEAVKLAEEYLDKHPISLPARLQDPHSVLGKTTSQNGGKGRQNDLGIYPNGRPDMKELGELE